MFGEPVHQFSLVVPAWIGVGICVLASVASALVVLRDMQRRRRSDAFDVVFPRRPRVYIAGGSSERLTVVRPLIELARVLGVDVVHDWTADPGWDLGRMPTSEEFRESALRDLDAIRRADVVWLVVPAQKSEGAAAEIGYALALKKRLIVSGEVGARNIFALLARPEDVFASHEEALARLSDRSDTNVAAS